MPAVELPINAMAIEAWARKAGSAVVEGATAFNSLLTWAHPAASGRGLAYAWLAVQLAFLLTPSWLLLQGLVAFVAAPVYLMYQEPADRAYATLLLPHVTRAAEVLQSGKASVAATAAANQVPLLIGGVVASTLFVYAFWDVLSFSGIATFAALAVAAHDTLLHLTAAAPAGNARVD